MKKHKTLSNINHRFSQIFSLKSVKICAVYICVISVPFFRLAAQQTFEFKHLQEKDGVTNFVINCFLKDNAGYLWVGTFDGLYRFDGSHFLHFKKNSSDNNSLQNNVVHDLATDQDGNIWYSTRFGVGNYNVKTNQFENFEKVNNKTIGLVFNIHCDRAGIIWFSGLEGLYSYSKKDKKFQFYKNDSPISDFNQTYIQKNGLVEDPFKPGFWLACVEGLKYFDIPKKKFFYYNNNPQNLPFFKKQVTSAISINKQNQIIFGSNYNEISIVDTKALKIVRKIILNDSEINKDNEISTTFTDSEHNIWVSTWDYRNYFIDGKNDKIMLFKHSNDNSSSVAGDFFWTAWQDEEGTIFLGTINGISFTNPKKQFYKEYEISKKIPEVIKGNDHISFFYEENDGSWLFGTQNNGIFKYNPTTAEIKKYPISTTKVRFFKKHQNIYYLGSDEGLFIYDFNSKKLSKIELPLEVEKWQKAIIDMEIENDSTIWFANSGKFVLKYNTFTKKLTPFDIIQDKKRDFMANYLPQIFINNKKEVWVNTYNHGLSKFSKEKQAFELSKPLEYGNFETRSLKPVVDKNNFIWIPYSGIGLMKFDEKTKKSTLWSEFEGLYSNLLHTNCVDNFGKIWTAAYNKISIYNPASNGFQNFHLPVSESNFEYNNRLYNLKNGNIISLMKGSLVEFFPERLLKDNLKNAPLINRLVLTDTLINVTENSKIHLNVSQNSFNIIFGYLPLNLQNPYQFHYKLEGFNKDWVNNGSQVYANFANLSGGEYVFKLKALNGNLESKIAEIRIHIDTIFYKTWWFITLVSLSLLGLAYAFYRSRINQSARFHHLQILTSSLEKDKTEIQYQNLINHLNPHFLFNSLTSLNSLITINPRQASTFLEKLSLIYRYILQNKEKEWVSLKQELDFVQHYIDLQKSRFEDGLLINIDVSEAFFNKNIVPVTIQNLIENAIKHNIIDDESPLKINIFIENDYLFVKNNLQKKNFVETSNKQGLESLKNLYKYLTSNPLETIENEYSFTVKIPLF